LPEVCWIPEKAPALRVLFSYNTVGSVDRVFGAGGVGKTMKYFAGAVFFP
jgi:hypothetical protein